MIFQVSSNCRMFMLTYTLVQVSGCVPDIINIKFFIKQFEKKRFNDSMLNYFTLSKLSSTQSKLQESN